MTACSTETISEHRPLSMRIPSHVLSMCDATVLCEPKTTARVVPALPVPPVSRCRLPRSAGSSRLIAVPGSWSSTLQCPLSWIAHIILVATLTAYSPLDTHDSLPTLLVWRPLTGPRRSVLQPNPPTDTHVRCAGCGVVLCCAVLIVAAARRAGDHQKKKKEKNALGRLKRKE
ncbi:hypothetical protein BKA80DRAFT_264537 [Phyllosticta citrichinensis]